MVKGSLRLRYVPLINANCPLSVPFLANFKFLSHVCRSSIFFNFVSRTKVKIGIQIELISILRIPFLLIFIASIFIFEF